LYPTRSGVTLAPLEMALQAGQLFGNYRIVRLLGEGGFGEVYLAENPHIERRAAVKVLHATLAQDKELVRRFLNEARAASAIRHPNIIDVFDAGVTPEGAPYILMEFLEGVSLQKRLADVGRLALLQVLDIASQAGSALAAAHESGIVHRDLKPENLFLVPDRVVPSGERIKVLDFGIAKIKHSGSKGGTVKTQTGLIMGSPAYMSPEQCKDSADVDLRADIYSFATIVYEMLAGKTPYVATSGTALLVMHLTETPQPLRELVPDVPAQVEAAIARALSRARDDRFDSMAAFIGALSASAGGTTAVLDSPLRSVNRPAEITSPSSRVERTVALPASTTFSRATGEIGEADSDENMMRATRSRRWPFFVVGSAAVVGLAIFLLARPSHTPAPRATTRPASPVASPAEPVSLEPPASPAVVPGTPDAGLATPAVANPPAANRRQRAAASDTKSSPTTKKQTEGSSDEEWVAH
jgi:serine/threonine protein kinase